MFHHVPHGKLITSLDAAVAATAKITAAAMTSTTKYDPQASVESRANVNQLASPLTMNTLFRDANGEFFPIFLPLSLSLFLILDLVKFLRLLHRTRESKVKLTSHSS